jgi:hypothetical protein
VYVTELLARQKINKMRQVIQQIKGSQRPNFVIEWIGGVAMDGPAQPGFLKVQSHTFRFSFRPPHITHQNQSSITSQQFINLNTVVESKSDQKREVQRER